MGRFSAAFTFDGSKGFQKFQGSDLANWPPAQSGEQVKLQAAKITAGVGCHDVVPVHLLPPLRGYSFQGRALFLRDCRLGSASVGARVYALLQLLPGCIAAAASVFQAHCGEDAEG